jgi:hypothetical protein
MTLDDPLINTSQAAKLAGFKHPASFAGWAKNHGVYPSQTLAKKMGGRPVHLYLTSDALKIAAMRDPERQKDDDTITDVEAVKILGYKNVATLRELASKNPDAIHKKIILENGKLRNYYSRKNMLEVREMVKTRALNFRNSRKEIYGLDDDEENYDPTKRYQDGFVIKDTPLIDRKTTNLTTTLYKILHNMRMQLCQ